MPRPAGPYGRHSPDSATRETDSVPSVRLPAGVRPSLNSMGGGSGRESFVAAAPRPRKTRITPADCRIADVTGGVRKEGCCTPLYSETKVPDCQIVLTFGLRRRATRLAQDVHFGIARTSLFRRRVTTSSVAKRSPIACGNVRFL